MLTIASPANGDRIATSKMTVTGTIEDAHPSKVVVRGVVATIANGTFTAVDVPLDEGDTQIVASGEDAVGNPAQPVALSVLVDSLAPTVSLDAATAPLVATSKTTVTGKVSDAHLESVTVNGITAVVTGDTFSVDVPLDEGPNVVKAVAVDTFGHSATSNAIALELDTTPPALAIDTPAPGANCFAGGSAIAVGGTFGDLHPLASGTASVKLEVRAADGTLTTTDAALDGSGRRWSASVNLGAKDGTATITAIATDAVGLVTRVARSFRVDATVPQVTILLDGGAFAGSAPGAAAVAGEVPALLARAIAPRVLVADGPTVAPPPAVLTLDGAAYVEGTPIASEGTHLLVARAVDCAGHEGAAHVTFAIDTSPPRLLTTTPADGAKLGDPVASFSGTSDGDLASATVNGVAASVSPGGASSPASFTAPFAWKEGANAVQIALVDRAGNRATFTRPRIGPADPERGRLLPRRLAVSSLERE